jgi:hypothetical protein
MTNHILKGNWLKDGNHYKNEKQNFTLILTSRKHPTENKPNKYIIIQYPNEKPMYVSGLFPTKKEGIFKLDYKGIKYQLQYVNPTEFHILSAPQ